MARIFAPHLPKPTRDEYAELVIRSNILSWASGQHRDDIRCVVEYDWAHDGLRRLSELLFRVAWNMVMAMPMHVHHAHQLATYLDITEAEAYALAAIVAAGALDYPYVGC